MNIVNVNKYECDLIPYLRTLDWLSANHCVGQHPG